MTTKGNKVMQAWSLFDRLRYQFPCWPATFSMCGCERASARGADKCHLCLTEELAAIIGRPQADRVLAALVETHAAWDDIYIQLKKDE